MRVVLPTKDDPARVVIADCLDVLRALADKCVDTVVTSPPYNQLGSRIPTKGSGRYPNHFLRGVNESGYSDDMDEDEYQSWLSTVVSECLRVCKGLVWINHKTRYREKVAIHPLHFLKFPVYCEVVWARNGGMAFNCKRFAPSHELIYAFGTPHHWDDSVNPLLSVWNMAIDTSSSGEGHPCAFPLAIPLRCIRASTPDGGIVLDPFAGSGTTGHAAIQEGCRCLLVEKDVKYEPIIRKRLRTALSDATLLPARAFRTKKTVPDETIF